MMSTNKNHPPLSSYDQSAPSDVVNAKRNQFGLGFVFSAPFKLKMIFPIYSMILCYCLVPKQDNIQTEDANLLQLFLICFFFQFKSCHYCCHHIPNQPICLLNSVNSAWCLHS